MVVQNKRIEKACCFYVSEFHLEMILLPYINEKINEDINILTEKNLKNTLEILLSKMNIAEENKQKIMQLKWDGEEPREKSNIIIVGSKKYIEDKNKEIECLKPVSILDCYEFDEEKDNMNYIVKNYQKTLNTLGKSNF